MRPAQLSNLIAALGTALADAQTRAFDRIGVLPSDAAALITVGYHRGTSVGALAPIIGFTQSAAVRSVDRLVANGLIEREHGADKRQVTLHLTPAGAALRTRILEARREAVERAVVLLDAKQQANLLTIVELMLAGLTDSRESADHICRLCDEDVCTPETCPVEDVARRYESSS
jgi:MarR family transcriptional regulator, negative regulator of the multidrug operon emrRAB